MKRKAIFVPIAATLASALLLVGCSKDPHSVRITSKNEDTFMEEIKDMKGLTVDETRLLIAYQIQRGMGKAFGAAPDNASGKTVGDLLIRLKQQAAEEKTEADRQKRLADEAKAKADALAAELRKSVELTVFDKGFVPSNPMSGRYEDEITIKCAYQNNSAKNIRAFRGKVQFTDLFGAEIYTSGLTISDPIEAGKKGTWTGVIKYNQFKSEDERLRNSDLKDMKVNWIPESVIFTDGTQIPTESSSS